MRSNSSEIFEVFAKGDEFAATLERGRAALEALLQEVTLIESHGSPAGVIQEISGDRELVKRDNERLRAELAALDEENRRFARRSVDAEAHNEALVNLYVASCQLHASLASENVVRAIEDIVVGLIGAAEWALFERDGDGDDYVLRAGDDVAGRFPSGRLGVDNGAEGVAIGSKTATVPELGSRGDSLVLLPLVVDDDCLGLLAIYATLPHKRDGYSPLDHELLNLLSGQAATALLSARLYASRLSQTQPK